MSSFEQNMITIFGDKGKQWLNELPSILANLIKHYNLSQLEPVSNMSFNYVAWKNNLEYNFIPGDIRNNSFFKQNGKHQII